MTPQAPDHHEVPAVFINQPSLVPQRRLTASCNSDTGPAFRGRKRRPCACTIVSRRTFAPHRCAGQEKIPRPTSQLLRKKDREGDLIKKMRDCTGAEIRDTLLYHLKFSDYLHEKQHTANCTYS